MKLGSLKQKFDDIAEGPGKERDAFYPTLYLSNKQLEAVGYEGGRAGETMMLVAKVKVASVSDTQSGRNVSFELIEGAVTPEKDAPDASSILFPNDKK